MCGFARSNHWAKAVNVYECASVCVCERNTEKKVRRRLLSSWAMVPDFVPPRRIHGIAASWWFLVGRRLHRREIKPPPSILWIVESHHGHRENEGVKGVKKNKIFLSALNLNIGQYYELACLRGAGLLSLHSLDQRSHVRRASRMHDFTCIRKAYWLLSNSSSQFLARA